MPGVGKTVAVQASQRPILKGLKGQFAGKSFDLSRGAVVFGRDPASCNLVFADAGLLSVERRGSYAICASNRLRRSPLARLQQALADFFATDPDGKHDAAALAKIRALSHHGRIKIVRKIAACEDGIRFDKLAKSTGLPPATLYRQIGALIAAEIVMPGEDSVGLRTYSLAPQPDGLFSVLVSLSLDPRIGQNSQSL